MTYPRHYAVLRMQIFLTLLFIFAQIAFFYVHAKMGSLVDALVNSSISRDMFHLKILFPIVMFVGLQILAYIFLIIFIWFLTASVSQFLKLTKLATYLFGIFIWFIVATTVIALNYYLYPYSFFAKELLQYKWVVLLIKPLLYMNLGFLFLSILLAYMNAFIFKSYQRLALFFLILVGLTEGVAVWDAFKIHLAKNKRVNRAQPNIIFVGLDSLRPDYTSYFGSKTVSTPNIDHFLNHSFNFKEAYTPLARTFPAWVSILTSKYPLHTEARNNLASLTNINKQMTIAKHLKVLGYQTLYATDEKRFSNVTENLGFDKLIGPKMGLDDFLLGSLSDNPLTNLIVNLPIGRVLFPYNYGNRAANITYEPNHFSHLVNLGLTSINDQPLFLAVHFCLSHWPYTWAGDGKKNTFLEASYRNSVEAVDKQLALLLKQLKKQNLLDNAIVVLLSDHGTALGLVGDRFISEETYQGDQKIMKHMPVYDLSFIPGNKRQSQTIATTYGQGTDLLSTTQHHVLLAFRQYGKQAKSNLVSSRASLIDIVPTVLDMADLPSISSDGISLKQYFENEALTNDRALFFETGDKIGEIEKEKIDVEKVVQKRIASYLMDKFTGLLYLDPFAEASLIKNKQRGVMYGDWVLAKYPMQKPYRLLPKKEDPTQLAMKQITIPPFFALANLKTGQWTLSLDSPFAKSAPVEKMYEMLKAFYGPELT